MSLVVTDGTLVTQDKERRVIRGNLTVEKNRIREVGGPGDSADRRLDATGCLVIPGLIDGYTRSAYVLLGPPRDVPWSEMHVAMVELQASLTKRDLEVAAALATANMLASGTTCFLDLFTWEEEVGRAATQAGIRALLAWAVETEEDLAHARRFLRKMRDRDRILPMAGLTGLIDPDLTKAVAELAHAGGTRWCLPLAERRADVYRFQRDAGARPVEWLEREGLLTPELLAVHCVWLTLNEIRALARGQVSVVHCPSSNQVTGAGGPMPLPEMLREGVVVGLGTDSPFLSGGFSLRSVMRACGFVHRGHRWDPTIVPVQALVDLSTISGARALGLGSGSLEPGETADFVILQPTTGMPAEPGESLSLLAYGGRTLRVRDVVVDGKLVVESGAVLGFDRVALQERVADLRRELGLAHPGD
ncbi:MAG: amidohydrolase family protein [Thermoplasmata archaeon]